MYITATQMTQTKEASYQIIIYTAYIMENPKNHIIQWQCHEWELLTSQSDSSTGSKTYLWKNKDE